MNRIRVFKGRKSGCWRWACRGHEDFWYSGFIPTQTEALASAARHLRLVHRSGS